MNPEVKVPEGYRLVEFPSTVQLVHDVCKAGYRVVAETAKPYDPQPVRYWQGWIDTQIAYYERGGSGDRPCPCGSGLPSHWEYDARGIPLDRVCPKCKKQKLKKYRSDVLTDPNYQTDEPIEEET